MSTVMRHQSGVTIIEFTLVLLVAAAIIFYGIQQYQMLQRDRDIAEVKANVDSLFRALGLYYQANCRENKNENGDIIKVGTLDPNHNPIPDDPFVIDIEQQLNAPGYISIWPPQASPIVERYDAQFNRVDSIYNIYQCYKDPSTGKVDCSKPEPTVSAGNEKNVVLWRAQISVQLKNPEQAQAWLRILGANCISEASGTTGAIEPCARAAGTGEYLVWEQLPSFSSPSLVSELWLSTPRLKQVNQQYTNADLEAFNQFPWALPPTTYYLCGG